MRKGKIFDLLIDLIFSKKPSRYQRDYSKDWDKILNKIIDEAIFEGEKNYCAKFKLNDVTYTIWASNYPYSYGYAHKINGEDVPHSLQYRASEKTMKKLYEFLNEPRFIDEQARVKKMKKYITGKD
ncbi:hypothetical protein [Pantoea agglomerans]|uniref:hypothetical protein n=1 Tax=Enterobacter agglomerans TaxID=549 RepID=UPI0011B08DEA|nr:hypothetical protein [Pantoea agglomerans]UBN56095.1 hypothetical protein LB453_11365 [Pantoea agglomerans]